MSRALAELRAPEVAERLSSTSIVVQPIAAVEQHGPHLPLSTDCLVVEAVVDALCAARGDELDLWVLPPLRYGRSTEHVWAPGTVSLSTTTLLAVLGDVGRAVARLPARTLVLANGHGGNTALLNVALRDLRVDTGLGTFLAHPSVPPDHGGTSTTGELGMGIHAGHEETSLLLHLRPDLVDLAAASRQVPEHLASNGRVRFGGSVSFGWLSDDFGSTGVIGDPTGATAEHGRARFDAMVSEMGAAVEEIRDFRFR